MHELRNQAHLLPNTVPILNKFGTLMTKKAVEGKARESYKLAKQNELIENKQQRALKYLKQLGNY